MKWASLIWWAMAVVWALTMLYDVFAGHSAQYDSLMLLLCLILANVTDK